ncbi:MAG: hypothetical protein P8174_08165 [Gemmatimonadota bacterium]
MQWPLTRIVLAAFAAAAAFAALIQRFVPGGTGLRPTLQVLGVSAAIIAAFRAYERSRGRP